MRRWYVDNIYGNDLNYGDFDHPLKTVKKARYWAVNGDCLYIIKGKLIKKK